jgi:transcriptional repressor NrdR
MDCPTCSAETRVLETRSADGGAALRRRRECRECGRRFTSFERREHEPAWVVKRSGERQRFDRDKLRGALVRASHKRDVDPRDLELIVNRIEREAEDAGGELAAARIGELCLEGLEPLDRGAFLQFAGTLPDGSSGDRKDRDFSPLASVDSVRVEEDAPALPAETESRGES